MYPAEINSQRTRFAGAGIATATNWICNYAVVLVTPVGISNLGWRYYLIYAVLNAAFVPIVQLFYVETARLTLEEIDTLFEEGRHRIGHRSSPRSTLSSTSSPRTYGIDVSEKGQVLEIDHTKN